MTKLQYEVADGLIQGLTQKEIARAIHRSTSTIQAIAARIYHSTRTAGTIGLLRYFNKHQMLDINLRLKRDWTPLPSRFNGDNKGHK